MHDIQVSPNLYLKIKKIIIIMEDNYNSWSVMNYNMLGIRMHGNISYIYISIGQ